MADLENGTLVQHTSLGVGKIVAIEPTAVHVFFPSSGTRFAAKLRLPAARALLRTADVESNSWLEGLSAFALDREMRRYALAEGWLTHQEALDQFLSTFPKGFADGAYVGRDGRAGRWRAAHESWAAAFGKGEAERLAAAESFDELVERALHADKAIAPLHLPDDEDAVKKALSKKATARPFCSALAELLGVPSPGRARFEKLFAAARDLPVEPDQQWLVATLFPFVASPDRHVLVRPRIACEAAERLGFDLRYEESPTWATYAALRAFSAQLLGRLERNGAKDFIDVESFLHAIATIKRRVKRSPRKATASGA
ncbi:MAG TPA: hypothetical protein VIV57_25755 [Anaeromyxobacter sp.]